MRMIVINSIMRTLMLLRKHFKMTGTKVFLDIGNPFVECEPELANIVNKIVVNEDASESVREALPISKALKIVKSVLAKR